MVNRINFLKKISILALIATLNCFAGSLNEHGYMRAMHISEKDISASAIGGSIGVAPSFESVKTELDFYTVLPFGAKEDATAKLFSHNTSGYSILGVASLAYQKDGLLVTAGRQKVITPLIDMDDGRIIPNLFEGVSLKYDINEKNKLEAYYLTKMSGFWSQIYSGEDMGRFVSMSKATGYGDIVANAAVWGIGWTQKNQNSKITAFAYHSPNLLNLFYGEYQAKYAIDKDNVVEFSIQGTKQNADGALKNYLSNKDKTLNQDYIALKLGYSHKELSVYAAAARISDAKGKLDKNMMNVWAGIPQYTVLNEHVMKSFDTDGAKLYKAFAGYKFTHNIEATASYLYVDTLKSKGLQDTGVAEFVVSGKERNFSLNAVLLLRNDNNENKSSILKSTLEYKF